MKGNYLENSLGGQSSMVMLSDIGPISQSRNRIRNNLNTTYAEATNTVTWSENEGIHEATCFVTAIAGEVAQAFVQGYIDVVVNADDEAMAAAMLTETDSQSSDSQIMRFSINERFVIRSKTAIKRLDVKPVDQGGNMSTIKLWVGAH